MEKITVALAGNPNAGKTTQFNNFTGAHQHVGNYPGVTVEKKEGARRYRDCDFHFVDLPGTYGLTAHSRDELVARDYLVEARPDVVINIVDASNLEKNLYLTVQLLELGLPVIIALNMSDVARRKGFEVDARRLGELLGAPCIPTVAVKNEGTIELLDAVLAFMRGELEIRGAEVAFSPALENQVAALAGVLEAEDPAVFRRFSRRWLAIKLLEGDPEAEKIVARLDRRAEIGQALEKALQTIRTFYPEKPEALIALERYGFISGACREAVARRDDYHERHDLSDRIDLVFLNRFWGLPILLCMMWLLFRFVFALSEPLASLVEILQYRLAAFAAGRLPAGSVVQSLVSDALIGGVGSVLVFVPVIFAVFLAIAFLEDSGYLARAAFLMDRLMHRIGLHGRSFIPMLLGFGCNVPGIMAARTISDEKDRLVTILINPFMSCGARLPVYALLIGAFFPARIAGNVLFSVYLVGMAVAVASAKLFRKTILQGEAEPFVMELPPYRMPTGRGLMIHMWERGVHYLQKAGLIIFVGVVAIWCLSNFPWTPVGAPDHGLRAGEARIGGDTAVSRERETARIRMENSYAGRIGRAVAPAFRAQGFDDWRMTVALFGGLVGKEVVVGTLGTLYSAEAHDGGEDESLRGALRRETRPDGTPRYNPIVAYALMVFILLYVPCVAVVAAIYRETNSWRWPLFSVVYNTLAAWLLSALVYQAGRLFL